MAVTVNGGGGISVSVAEGIGAGVTVANGGQVGVSVTGGIGPTIIVNGTATSVVGSIGVQPFIAGQNVTITTTGGGITILAANPPVSSVQGKKGAVTLTVADLTAAEAIHTHSTSQIQLFVSSVRALDSVYSVQGKTGTVTLSASDLTAASLVHTHSVAAITGLTPSAIGAANANHTHVVANISDFASSIPVHSVNGLTGDVLIDAVPSQDGNAGKFLTTDGFAAAWGDIPAIPSLTGNEGKYLSTDGISASWQVIDSLPSQAGNSGKVLSTDGSSPLWKSSFDAISGVLVAGSNVSIAENTTNSTISISSTVKPTGVIQTSSLYSYIYVGSTSPKYFKIIPLESDGVMVVLPPPQSGFQGMEFVIANRGTNQGWIVNVLEDQGEDSVNVAGLDAQEWSIFANDGTSWHSITPGVEY